MRLRFSLRELETFVAISDYGTFAVAGEVVGLTQSAISLQIKSLEANLDTELFDRTKRPPIMNDKGIKLVKRAREILNLCQTLKEDVANPQLGGILRLGVIPTVMSGVLPPTLLRLQASHPQLMVELSSGLSVQLIRQVTTGDLDAAIVTEPTQLGRGLSWHAFDEENFVVIAPNSASEDVDVAVLTKYPFIQFQPQTYAGQQIVTLLKDRGIKVNTQMHLDSMESIAKMVACGLGVSVVPQRSIDKPFPDGIKVFPFGVTPTTRVVGVIERVSGPRHEFIQVLTDALIQQTKQDKP